MARVVINQTNFTGGELSPRMKGRTDVARYQTGAETLENVKVVVHGGADRREGLRYLATTKWGGQYPSRVLPYVYSSDQSFCLEVGGLYMRVFDASTGAVILNAAGTAPLEMVSPYHSYELDELTTCQDADLLFLHHPNYPTYVVRRLSATVWTCTPFRFVTQPFAELGHVVDKQLNIDNPAVGTGRTMTTSNLSTPSAPTSVSASAMNGGAKVSWAAPASNGGTPVQFYKVTASPGGANVTTADASTSAVIPGLTNGTAYTFTVVAHNKVGDGTASSASNSVTPNTSAPLANIGVTANFLNEVVSVKNGDVSNIQGPTASATNGVGPYKYQWTKLSGGSLLISIQTGNAAQLVLRSSGFNTSNYGRFRCTVTDSLGGVGSIDVGVTVVHETTITTKTGPGTGMGDA